VDGWRNRLAEFDEEHRNMFEGGSLSQLFLRYPLTVCHPVFVGIIYGLLISLPLILPLGYEAYSIEKTLNELLLEWVLLMISIIAMCSFLGGFSSLASSIFKRPPIHLENRRRYLFPFPFIGMIIITLTTFYDLESWINSLGLIFLIIPGPLYIHLSYAPRWRMLDRIDRGLDPLEGMSRTIDKIKTSNIGIQSDYEVEEAVSEL
jgi:amino acid transporter